MLQSRIRRGQMDKKITFIKKVIVSSTSNEDKLSTWVEVATNPEVWARIIQKPGRELVVADQVQSVFQTHFIVDYREDITEENRIVYNEKVYNIITITEHEESRSGYLLIVADVIPNETFVST